MKVWRRRDGLWGGKYVLDFLKKEVVFYVYCMLTKYLYPKSPKTIYLIVVQCKTILWHGVMLSRWITLDHAMGPSLYIYIMY